MKAIVMNIEPLTMVTTEDHADNFVDVMYHDGKVEEFIHIYPEWYNIIDDEMEFSYHISWLEVVE